MKEKTFEKALVGAVEALRPHAMRLTRDRFDSDDLLQDTLLKAYTKSHAFRQGSNLEAWLYAIMRNTFLSGRKRAGRKREVYFIEPSELENKQQTQNHAEGLFLSQELQKLLLCTPKHLREPFMRHYRGFRYEEIADQLQVPLGTIKTRIYLVRQTLQANLFIEKHKA